MRHRFKRIQCRTAFVVVLFAILFPCSAFADGDPQKGVRTFHNLCMPCHSITPGRHMTGPSLKDIVGRKAGTADGFDRYSKALSQSAIEWNEQTLKTWLAEPQVLVPGNAMPAIAADEQARADIVAYLVATQKTGTPPLGDIPKPHEKTLDLKAAGPATRIASIGFCRDTYTLEMANGSMLLFWEQNLRFKTDASKLGPSPTKPVLVPGGMQGDRAYVVFASPQEISGFIRADCAKP